MAHHPERIKTFYMLNLKRINLRRRIGRWREMPEGKVKLIGWKLGILGQKRKNSSTDAEGNIQEYSTDNGKREGKGKRSQIWLYLREWEGGINWREDELSGLPSWPSLLAANCWRKEDDRDKWWSPIHPSIEWKCTEQCMRAYSSLDKLWPTIIVIRCTAWRPWHFPSSSSERGPVFVV
jgi:hypothetical protein